MASDGARKVSRSGTAVAVRKPSTHCARCGKKKSTPGKGASSSYVDPLEYEGDPYCSRRCCELDLGIAENAGEEGEAT